MIPASSFGDSLGESWECGRSLAVGELLSIFGFLDPRVGMPWLRAIAAGG
jgi:hypothetical protein